MVFKQKMKTLSFEMTRRCNLKCPFCSKGEPQNMDITKEVIDKTLDEMQDVYINTIRLSGGEPFLAADMLVYLLSEIERRHIIVRDIFAFTNGTILNPRIRDAFDRICKYIALYVDELPEVKEIPALRDIKEAQRYKGITGKRVGIVVSADAGKYHHNMHLVDEALSFYGEIDNSTFAIVRQDYEIPSDGLRIDCIIVEGKAEKNYISLIPEMEKYGQCRRIVNKYNFYDSESGFLSKSITISISSNGNVHPGCMMPYEKIDADPMFNIFQCSNSFFDLVDSFCWQHPLSEEQNNQREQYQAAVWCKEHGIKFLSEIRPEDEQLEEFFNILTDEYEKTAVMMHETLPYLDRVDIQVLAFVSLAMSVGMNNIPESVFRNYLESYSGLTVEAINTIIPINMWKLFKMALSLAKKNDQLAKTTK